MRHLIITFFPCIYFISIHAPTWGATLKVIGIKWLSQFQSTHPRGVRLFIIWDRGVQGDFNPRTHVGCDGDGLAHILATRISIHAPTWGATPTAFANLETLIFQSTHPRGVRPTGSRLTAWSSSNFNPRTHVGCDGRLREASTVWQEFQSTHPRGVRPPPSRPQPQPLSFQSTHPRGVRPATFCGSCHTHRNFNPRTHVGCDLPGLLVYLPAVISIHAPTWGATRRSRRMRTRFRLFQSTHPRGVRLSSPTLGSIGFYFNPRTHVGCDRDDGHSNSLIYHFNPRTHVGCDG